MAAKNTFEYILGISWFILSVITSLANDVITKFVGASVPSIQITFMRFLITSIVLLPIVLKNHELHRLKPEMKLAHLLRGSLLFVGMISWSYGLSIAPITTATMMTFTIPIFVLILGALILKEHISWHRSFATIIGFVGIAFVLAPNPSDFNPNILIFLVAALSFALLDITNKYFISSDSIIAMMFYSSLVACFMAFGPAMYYWQDISDYDFILFGLLGVGSTLISYFLLKAFTYVEATAVSPYRYIELLLSAVVGILLFDETLTLHTIIGAIIIVLSTTLNGYAEHRAIQKKSESIS
jgi:S-adenosylmethionine uptake transporter